MNYEFYGSGQKIILFLHGWGGSTLSFKWFADCLQTDFRVFNLDFCGFGKSLEPQTPMGVGDYAQKVKDLLLKEEVTKCYVVAHSFGGRVALKLCEIFDVEKLILVDSAGIKPKFSFKKFIKIEAYKCKKLLVKLGLKNKKCLDNAGSDDYRVLSDSMKKTFIKVIQEDLSVCAQNVKCETLIVWGEKDKETPLYMARKLNKLIKNSELVVLENTGHFCYLEKPALFLQMITIFLGVNYDYGQYIA